MNKNRWFCLLAFPIVPIQAYFAAHGFLIAIRWLETQKPNFDGVNILVLVALGMAFLLNVTWAEARIIYEVWNGKTG